MTSGDKIRYFFEDGVKDEKGRITIVHLSNTQFNIDNSGIIGQKHFELYMTGPHDLVVHI